MKKKQKKMLIRIIISAALLIILLLLGHVGILPENGPIRFISFMIPYAVVGYDVLRKSCKNIMNGQVFDEEFLMSIATLGAIALALYSGSGDYTEAVAVMLFYQVGELFQAYAVGKSRKNISELMDIRPDYAHIEVRSKGEQTINSPETAANLPETTITSPETMTIETVDPDEVEIGSIIVVQPGEKVPIDGIVIEGSSTLDTAALTGESLPRTVQEGDEIISGCINETGLLRIETTKEFGDSTVSKILDLVENASSKKSRSENFITRFARVYTPIVVFAALALAVLPPLVNLVILGNAAAWNVWIYRALAFLVASCPCALVVSIPLSFFAGIGGASNAGVLVKGSNYLETLSKAKTVVFDKTGTLTQGVFKVTEIHIAASGYSEEKFLEYAALAESASSHPISKSIRRAYTESTNKELDRNRVSGIEEIGGNGVTALVDGKSLAVGNDKLMNAQNIDFARGDSAGAVSTGKPGNAERLEGTIIHVAIDGEYAGYIVISDVLKPTSKEAINRLKHSGVRKTVMLTGDNRFVAEKVASELDIDEVHAELLPGDKVDEIEKLLYNKANKKDAVVFVGDGINDAPVLSRADIGIAMGAMGSDAAIEAADVVLMDDDPKQISKAIKISRKALRIVYENIVFAIGVKFLCLVFVAIGLAGMWLAVFADVGVMVIAVLNAIRALYVKKL